MNKVFLYRGITSELDFITKTMLDFPIIIDFLFDKYGMNELTCKLVLTTQGSPEYFFGTIKLKEESGQLVYYQKLDFQFAHELTHAIQDHQKRGLPIQCRQTTGGKFEQMPFPNHSPQETEAVANSVWIIEKVLCYDNYNARDRDYPEYYDYEKAFSLVDSKDIEKVWENNSL